ncbi:type II toxin-antitoxin system PemK/MazF family toxin [Okeania sp. SIO3I5]|uniref:type II toxin-antitoxin system PemK/MazF family toxin n=1 Tax=Okeania sp. SIO3I5 TaxID=2607805 RepID=UPI0025CBB332|nr:type II toxin-antitoxin system PemK/MazF family toxin [Okeania sp. SIO3I5]
MPFTSAKVGKEAISPAVVYVPASTKNGLATDSLLVCVDLMTFDKSRLVEQVGELETELLKQDQAIVKRYLDL